MGAAVKGFYVNRRRTQDYYASIVAGLTLAAAGLRCYHLAAKGLWADEIFTALYAGPHNNLATVIHNAVSTPLPSPPLWFLVTHLFTKLIGSSEEILRLPSALAGTLCIPAIYALGKTLFNRRVGLAGATLLAVSPLHIHFSQEARAYAAVVLFSLVACFFFYRGLTRRRWRWWIGFGLFTLVNLYLHLTAALVLASQVAIAGIVFLQQSRGSARRALPLLVSLLIVLIGYSPMAPFLLSGIQGPRGLGSMEDIEGLAISFQGFLSLFAGFGAGTGVALSLYLSACLFGLANAFLYYRRQFYLLLGWISIPFVLILLLRPRHWFAAKYVISILPIYLIAISLGLESLARSFSVAVGRSDGLAEVIRKSVVHGTIKIGTIRRIVLRGPEQADVNQRIAAWRPSLPTTSLAVMLLLYVLLSGLSLLTVYDWQNDPWKQIGLFLNANAHPDDALIVVPFNQEILTMAPEEMMAFYGPTGKQVDVIPLGSRDQFETALAGHARLWVLIEHNADPGLGWEVKSWLEGHPAIELNLGSGAIILYTESAIASTEKLIDRVAQLDINNANAFHSIAEVFLDLNRWDEALEVYNRAVALEPDEARWQIYRQAVIYQESGEKYLAQDEYLRAVQLKTVRKEAYTSLGNFYRRTGNLQEAVRAYRLAVSPYKELPPGSEPYYDVRALRETIIELERLLNKN